MNEGERKEDRKKKLEFYKVKDDTENEIGRKKNDSKMRKVNSIRKRMIQKTRL